MLRNGIGQLDPRMLTDFVDGENRSGVRDTLEGSNRDTNRLRKVVNLVEHCRAAFRTKVEPHVVTFVRESVVQRRLPLDLDLASLQPSLHAEGTSGSLLACIAVANR